ncbi:hypothetical protein [Thalassospira profundimaris]|uniref:Uncharacterized protein n=1 Tax=Thalassospira profundimaris TaxID=502049 RepID=A0A367WRM1_9PROT|nr:hypothetical protein [Thalassospira profundimaris]RCK43201.1 hypothetical protein TH30_19475 [Thalassospira profundimaris]
MAVSEHIEVWSRWAFIGWAWTRCAFLLQCVYFVVGVALPANVETLADLINTFGAYSLRTLGYGLFFQCAASLCVGAIAVCVVVLRQMFIDFFGAEQTSETNIPSDTPHGPTVDYEARVTMNDVTMKRVYSGGPDQLAALGLRPAPRRSDQSRKG